MKLLNHIKNKSIKRNMLLIKKIFSNNFSNLDLSNMDLSNFSFNFWRDIVIKNTNFSNSKINFTPQNLSKNVNGIKKLENVNFQNVDLSYLKEADFERIIIENTNLKNTGLNINFNNIKYPSETLYGVTLDKNIIISPYQKINMKTLELNPDYSFSDIQIIQAVTQTFDTHFCSIVKEYRDKEEIEFMFDMSIEQYYCLMNNYIKEIVSTLNKFNHTTMSKLINKMLEHSEIDDVFSFLTRQNIDMCFKQIDFTREDIDILSMWEIKGNITFDHCTFETNYITARKNYEPFQGVFARSIKYKDCSFYNDSYLNNRTKKVAQTPFSTNTSIYVKIGNKCNGNCSFCKNNTENKTSTNIEKITNTLCDIDLLSHLDEIYFGGGEPSLYLEEIKSISTKLRNLSYEKNISRPNLYFFTNGGGNWEKIYNYLFSYFTVILSRHEIDSEKNKQIIGVKYDLDNPYLKKFIMYRKLILSLTCSDLNIRKNFLREYFEFGRDLGVHNFIIQNLEAKTDMAIPNLDEYLSEFKEYLIEQGLSTQRKIVSTSYFDLDLLSGNGYSVALKKYFEPKDLEEHMKYQAKHSFDLGMDSNGEMYNDFQMIKKLKK